MERFLLKSYRRLIPNRLKRALSAELKARVLEILLYLTSRPGFADLRLRHRARTAERGGDWEAASRCWQGLALLSRPEVAETDDPAATPPALIPPLPGMAEEDALRKTRYALTGLRRARAHRALALYAEGRDRHAAELVCRVVESLPDHRVLKNDPVILEAAATWLRRALAEDGFAPGSGAAPAATPPRRIVLCLDVLKVSDVHTHARVLFSICRNLLTLDPAIETHLVVTGERFAATTPIVAPIFHPGRAAEVAAMARAAMKDHAGTRFHLHMFDSPGLEGVAATCRKILGIAPDVMLYGGGHRGFFSNESRLVRHALYEHLPTAFFYVQSNNEIDPALDMVIARGPHRIIGNPGAARVRVQPYPTIDPAEAAPPPPAILPGKRESGVIVSAIAGLRMNQRLAQQDRATLEALFSVLDRVPGTVWHFIGASDPAALARDLPVIGRRVARGQIVVHGVLPFEAFRKRVGGAALFIHPPGFTGGSGGAAVARDAGVPILTTRDSDVSGRQPPGTIFADTEPRALAQRAVEVLRDPAEWEAVVRAQIAHKAWIRETAPQGFYDCLAEAVDLYQRRRSGAGEAPAPAADAVQNPTRAAYSASG